MTGDDGVTVFALPIRIEAFCNWLDGRRATKEETIFALERKMLDDWANDGRRALCAKDDPDAVAQEANALKEARPTEARLKSDLVGSSLKCGSDNWCNVVSSESLRAFKVSSIVPEKGSLKYKLELSFDSCNTSPLHPVEKDNVRCAGMLTLVYDRTDLSWRVRSLGNGTAKVFDRQLLPLSKQ